MSRSFSRDISIPFSDVTFSYHAYRVRSRRFVVQPCRCHLSHVRDAEQRANLGKFSSHQQCANLNKQKDPTKPRRSRLEGLRGASQRGRQTPSERCKGEKKQSTRQNTTKNLGYILLELSMPSTDYFANTSRHLEQPELFYP